MTFKPSFEIYVIARGFLLKVNEKEIMPNISQNNLNDYMKKAMKAANQEVDPVMQSILGDDEIEDFGVYQNSDVFYFKTWEGVQKKMAEYLPTPPSEQKPR